MATPDLTAESDAGSSGLRGDIRAAMKESAAPVEAVATTPAATEAKAEPAKEAKEPAKDGRQRDDGGRFAPKEGEAKANPAEAAPAAAQEVAAAPAPVIESKPPESWTAAEKAVWPTLSKDAQAAIQRREAEVHKGFTRQDEERAFGRGMQQALMPYMPMIQARGFQNPVQAVQQMLSAFHVMDHGTPQQKQQLLANVAQRTGLDLNALAQQQPSGVDPMVQQLQQRLDQMEADRQRSHQEQFAGQVRHEADKLDQMKADPKFARLDDYRQQMARFVASGLATTAEEAYTMAARQDPAYVSSQVEAELEKRRKEAEAKAESARKASGSVTGGPGKAIPDKSQPDRSLRDELRANIRAAGGGRL